MPAPTLIASYSSDYTLAGTSKNVSITCNAGDAIIIYALSSKNGTLNNTPTATGLDFVGQITSSSSATNGSVEIYYSLFLPASTNLTVTMTESSGTTPWGFTCLVVRDCYDVRGTGFTNSTGVPFLSSTPAYDQSSYLFISTDTAAIDGSTRAWRTVNGTTPTNANGLELTYQYVASNYTAYAALYPKVGSGGSISAFGLTSPAAQTYRCACVEIIGSPTGRRALSTLGSYAAANTKSTSVILKTSDKNAVVIGVAAVGVQPGNGTDTNITTTMTHDGRPMTSIAKVHSNNGSQGYIEVFKLLNPSTYFASQLVLSASSSVDLNLMGAIITNINQENPIVDLHVDYGNSGTASTTLNNAIPRNPIFSAMVSGTNISGTSDGSTGLVNNTSQQNFNNSSDGGCAAYQVIIIPKAPQTVGWTLASGPWAMISFSLNATNYFPPGIIYGLGM